MAGFLANSEKPIGAERKKKHSCESPRQRRFSQRHFFQNWSEDESVLNWFWNPHVSDLQEITFPVNIFSKVWLGSCKKRVIEKQLEEEYCGWLVHHELVKVFRIKPIWFEWYWRLCGSKLGIKIYQNRSQNEVNMGRHLGINFWSI